MNSIIRFLVFFTILLSVFFGIQYYCIRRLSALFHFNYDYKILFCFCATTLNFITITMLSRRFWNVGVQFWYLISVGYIGSMVILFSLLLLHQLIHKLLPLSQKGTQYLVVISFVGLIVYSIFNARHLTVKTVKIPTTKIGESANTTIVQISDLHLGAIHGKRLVERVVAKTNTLNPDIVVITGDLFDGTGRVTEETIQALNKTSTPTFFITGNHDTYAGLENVLEMLSKTSIKVLRNEKIIVNDTLQIIGLDYIGHIPQNDHVTNILQDISPENGYFTILLSHVPIDFSHFDHYPIDLVLAGHTHSGQIFPFSIFVKFFYPHHRISGLHQSNERYMYISSGTGTWGPPMRLGTRSEISVIRLLPPT